MLPNSPISNVERQAQLLRFIEQSQRASVSEICERFQVSEATARRDLEILAEAGKIQRVHGGALSVRRAPPELPVYQRMNDASMIKQRIGLAAARLVQDGETIFLGSGTTVLEVARGLMNHKNLTVITNSLLVLNQLIEQPDITVISLGGLLRRSELSMIGHITELALGELRADRVIMGIRALDLTEGLTNQYLPETMTDRRILQLGRQVVIVADSSKCGRVSTAFVAPLTAMHTLVTDSDAPAEFINTVRERGIDVVQA